mgnify:CR=1 FL=1
MKKCLNILLIFFLCFFVTGCTGADDFCKSFKQVPYNYEAGGYSSYVTKEYRLQELDYYRYCKILPAIDNFYFSNKLGEELKQLQYSYAIENNLFQTNEEYYCVFREIIGYRALNTLATIPQNISQYKVIMDKDQEFQDILKVIDRYGADDLLREYVYLTYQQYDKSGAFNDYRVADIFIQRVIRIIELNEFHSLKDFEFVMIKVAKYNEDKKNAQMTLEFLGKYFYKDSRYYK